MSHRLALALTCLAVAGCDGTLPADGHSARPIPGSQAASQRPKRPVLDASAFHYGFDACDPNVFTCMDSQTLEYCSPSGLVAADCAAICGSAGYALSDGCGYDAGLGGDACFCDDAPAGPAAPSGLELGWSCVGDDLAYNDGSFVDSPIALDVNGRPYMDTTLDRKRFGTDTDAFRGSAAYLWDRLKWMPQLFVATAEYRESSKDNYRFQAYNVKNILGGIAPAITTNDRGRLRVYLDDPAFYSRSLYDRLKMEALPATSTVEMRMIANLGGNDPAANTDWSRAAAASLSASGRYFGGRLQSLVGLRRDSSRLWEYSTKRFFGPFAEAIAPPKRSAALPGEYVENLFMKQANTSYTAGLTWVLNKDVNVYGVFSESFIFLDDVTFEN